MLYGQYVDTDLEAEKEKIVRDHKAPRKPLSPYIFFSQEKRKEIKKESNKSAKQIMKEVSNEWKKIKDQKEKTAKYEYLSLRDREAYSILCKCVNLTNIVNSTV